MSELGGRERTRLFVCFLFWRLEEGKEKESFCWSHFVVNGTRRGLLRLFSLVFYTFETSAAVVAVAAAAAMVQQQQVAAALGEEVLLVVTSRPTVDRANGIITRHPHSHVRWANERTKKTKKTFASLVEDAREPVCVSRVFANRLTHL